MSGTATLGAATAQIDHVRVTINYTQLAMPHNMIRVVRVGNSMSRNDLAS